MNGEGREAGEDNEGVEVLGKGEYTIQSLILFRVRLFVEFRTRNKEG